MSTDLHCVPCNVEYLVCDNCDVCSECDICDVCSECSTCSTCSGCDDMSERTFRMVLDWPSVQLTRQATRMILQDRYSSRGKIKHAINCAPTLFGLIKMKSYLVSS